MNTYDIPNLPMDEQEAKLFGYMVIVLIFGALIYGTIQIIKEFRKK